jgi:hypothetical protein
MNFIHTHTHQLANLPNDAQVLELVAHNAQSIDTDMALRQQLALQQAEDKVPDDCLVSGMRAGSSHHM